VFRPYSRLLFLFAFGLAVLGAVGLDAVMRWIAGPNVQVATGSPPASKWSSGHTKRWLTSRFLAVLVIGVTAVQLGTYGRDINPPFLSSKTKPAFPATPLIRVLKSGGGGVSGWPNRVLPAFNGITGMFQPPMLDANVSLMFGIHSAEGYDSSLPGRTADVWRVVDGENPDVVLATKLAGAYRPSFYASTLRYDLLPRVGVDRIALTPAAANLPSVVPLLQALGWKRIYAGIDGTVYAWTGPPTGPTVVFAAEHTANDSTALKQFTSRGFDYRGVVILDGVGGSSSTSGSATVTSARLGINSAQIAVQSSKPGWLVVPDMWDPGWSATVNGVSVCVERADFNEQAIAVPAGRSIAVLRYRPVGLTAGLIISGISAMTCAAILIWPLTARARRRRSSQ